jgi:hypothetical protein
VVKSNGDIFPDGGGMTVMTINLETEGPTTTRLAAMTPTI